MEGEIRKVQFENPEGYWEYGGAFSVELAPGVSKDNIPKDAFIEGNSVRVENGRIRQAIGGIQFYAKDQPFRWPYKDIVAIRDRDGNPIWLNNDYRSEVPGKTKKTEKDPVVRHKKRSSYHSAGGPRSRIEQSKRAARKFSKEMKERG